MAQSAINSLMLTYKREIGVSVIESYSLKIDLPAFCIMAIRAADGKRLSVGRRLRKQSQGKRKQYD